VLEPDLGSRKALSKAEHPSAAAVAAAAAVTAMLRKSVKMASIPGELIGDEEGGGTMPA
jgi:hypothetical protein